MGSTVVLIAYGRHDRGKLFPKTIRQIDSLREPLQDTLGGLEEGTYNVYYDGTNQAEETAGRMGLALHTEEASREFLGCTAHLAPDEYDLTKALKLVEQAPQKYVIFVADPAYVSCFAKFYLSRMQKKVAVQGITQSEAVVIETDGTLHVISPRD
jgi:DNA-binding MurR/RpiR family transcriptional regulator